MEKYILVNNSVLFTELIFIMKALASQQWKYYDTNHIQYLF